MKNLLIIGARGWGREVLWAFRSDRKDIFVKGFLDDNIHALDDLNGDFPPIISSVEAYQVQPDDVFFCALGSSVYRKKYVDIIEAKGGVFISYIAPGAIVSPTAVIQDGTFIGTHTIVSDNVMIGRHVMIHGFCTLGHDVTIGDFASIEAYSFFGGFVEVGENSEIHVRSTVIHRKKIGRGASVGAASLVIRNVKDNTHVFGSPARVMEM